MESRRTIRSKDWFLKKLLSLGFTGEVKFDEPLKKYTTWRVGGPGDLLLFPESLSDIRSALRFVRENDLPLHVIGNGSNILVKDGGLRGVVLITKKLQKVKIAGDILTVGSGLKMPKLANIAAKNSLGGLEFSAGIPGTVGGAVVMNAGAHGNCIGNLVTKVISIDADCKEKTYHNSEIGFSYRNSIFKKSSEIVAEIELKLYQRDREEILKIMKENLSMRKEKQPLNFPNAGSVFKNSEEYSAGYLIDKVGCKGLQYGQAQISLKHANFIVNLGGASSTDILNLIEEVKQKVLEGFGINLELEVEIFGEE